MPPLVLSALMTGSEELAPVGLQKQLFVDDYVVAEIHNITRELSKVKKVEVVMKRENVRNNTTRS